MIPDFRSHIITKFTNPHIRVLSHRYRLRPRALVDISHIDLTQTVLGQRVSMPIGVAPTAMQKLATPDGECANARGK